MTIKNYQSVVYVSHPSKGLPENTEEVERIIKCLHKKFPDILFISPIHSFGYMYNDVPYVEGLNMCLWLLDKCYEMWVFGGYEHSAGCVSELAYCKNHGIPYKIFTDNKCFREIGLDCFNCVLCDDEDGGIYCNLRKISKELITYQQEEFNESN